MSFFEIASLSVLAINGILIPIVLYYVATGQGDRRQAFAKLEIRMDHLDGCIDSLRTVVIGSGITRTEFESKMVDLRSEVQVGMAAQTDARHDQAGKMALLVDATENRLTRRIEALEARNSREL